MLERVSPSAECAAHTILSRFEVPLRSQRYLGASFWKHGRENIDSPVWWPAYLEGIRNRAPAISSTSTFKFVTVPAMKATPQPRNRKDAHSLGRSFGISSKSQAQSSQAVASTNIESVTNGFSTSKHTVEETTRTTRLHPNNSFSENSTYVSAGNCDGEDTIFTQTWNKFVSAGLRPAEAPDVLQLLSTSRSETDLDRALRAYSLIPTYRRTSQYYQHALDSSIRLNRYPFAIRTIREAVSRRVDYETFFKFLSFCISKNLWVTASELCKGVEFQNIPGLRSAISETDLRQNFAGKYLSQFDSISDLPGKIVGLANRLKDNDPILVNHKTTLLDLCKRLTQVVVENEKSMKSISAQGILSIFALQQEIESDQKLHFAALATINQMSDKGARSQLAILIYKNFKSTYPRVLLPKWVIGTMIGICASGREPAMAYRALLIDYKNAYGGVESNMYLQVLRACASQGEVDDFAVVFNDFCKHGGPRGADDVNPLIRVYAVTGNSDMAQKQFDSIEPRFGFKPSVRNWNALLLAYSRSNQYVLAYQKFKEMQNHVQPDSHSWSIMVAIAAKRGDTAHAREIVKLARGNGITPPLAMIGAVVDSHLLNDEPEEAWPLVIDATETATKTQQSPVRLWNSMLRYFAFKSDSDSILNTQGQMAKYKVKADAMTYAALMTALVIKGRTSDAIEILRTLHFSQAVVANEFHYSILIHGFAMEKQRDLAMVVYNEMLQRFPRATPSAKLAMIYLEAMRDEQRAQTDYQMGRDQRQPDFSSTLAKIKEFMTDTKLADLASSLPNPGFGRKSVRNDLDNTYLTSLVAFLQRNDAHRSAREVVGMVKGHHEISRSKETIDTPSWISSLDRMLLELNASKSAKDWTNVCDIWKQIVDLVQKQATPQHAEGNGRKNSGYEAGKLHNIKTVGSSGSKFSGIIFQPFSANEPASERQTIIPAYRYVLSRALSSYIDALDKQQNYTEMLNTVRNVREQGFKLTSKNWNGLIQSLCRSASLDHQFLAFELFDRHFLPNAPAWEVIRRGEWVHPSEQRPRYYWDRVQKKQDDRKSRNALEKLDPGLMMPSYFTMVHLAIVWLKTTQSSFQGDNAMQKRLEFQTPGTVKLVKATPYLKDRVQGILLRGRRVVGDFLKQPLRAQQPSMPAGVQGSQLLIDQVDPDTLQEFEFQPKLDSYQITKDNLARAAKVFGETITSKIVDTTIGQYESTTDRDRRVLRQKRSKIKRLRELNQQLQDNARNSPPLVEAYVRGSSPYGPLTLSPDSESMRTPGEHRSRKDALTSGSMTNLRPLLDFEKIQRILDRNSARHLDHTVAASARDNKQLTRTNLLTRRLGRRLYPPSGKYRSTAKPRQKIKIPRIRRSKIFSSNAAMGLEAASQSAELITSRHLEWHQRLRGINKQRRLLKRYTKIYAAKQSQASVTSVPSKKLTNQLFAYRRFLRLTTGRLLAAESRFRDASGINPPLPPSRQRKSKGPAPSKLVTS